MCIRDSYSAMEIKRIKGVKSSKIAEVIGYADSEYVAYRENIAFFHHETSRPVTPSLGSVADEKRASMGRLSNYVAG